MPRFYLNKLVRDGVVDNMREMGQTPHVRQLTPPERARELIHKFIEEATELLAAMDREGGQPKVELADLKQLYIDCAAALGMTDAEIEEARAARYAKVGGFAKGLFVEALDLPEGDTWIEYYRKEPERFVEADNADEAR